MRSKFTLERPCVLCGAHRAYLFQNSDNLHRVVECSQCKLIYVDPLPTRTELEHHYDEAYYSEWISFQRVPRERLWQNRLDELLQYKQKGRLLDVGCGDGTFLRFTREGGFEVYGTEFSEYAAQRIEKLYSVPVFIGSLHEAEFPSEYFDVVTLYHVIEHVDSPARYLSETHRILREDGLLIVACPNVESYIFNLTYSSVQRETVSAFLKAGQRNSSLSFLALNCEDVVEKKTDFCSHPLDWMIQV